MYNLSPNSNDNPSKLGSKLKHESTMLDPRSVQPASTAIHLGGSDPCLGLPKCGSTDFRSGVTCFDCDPFGCQIRI